MDLCRLDEFECQGQTSRSPGTKNEKSAESSAFTMHCTAVHADGSLLADYVTYHVRPRQPIIDQQGLGLRGLVHKEAHPVIPDLH